MPMDKQARQAVNRAQTAYYAELKKIRANVDLSDAGKRKAMARAYATARNTVKDLRDGSEQQTAKRRADLERRLFATADRDSMTTIAYRDALDRVSRIKRPAEAQTLLRRADRHGDTSLCQAIFSHAVDKAQEGMGSDGAWREVIREYVTTVRPDLMPYLGEYDGILQADTKTARLEENIGASISRPAELAGVTDVEIQRLAREAAAPGDQAPAQPTGPSMHQNAAARQVDMGNPVIANVPTSSVGSGSPVVSNP